MVTDGRTTIRLDASRAAVEATRPSEACDAVLLTHAHRDAVGGLAALVGRIGDAGRRLPVYARPETIAAVQRRFRTLGDADLRPFSPGDRTRIGGWTISCVAVPHAADEARFPTVAWRLTCSGHSLVYASDVARPTDELRRFSRGAGLLVIDGATYRRRIFSHLRIDEDLPVVCRWPVERILLTQIGRSVPPHEELERIASRLCERAAPACDGLEIELPGS